MARAVTAASNSSVTSVVQLIRGEISALMIRSADELNIETAVLVSDVAPRLANE